MTPAAVQLYYCTQQKRNFTNDFFWGVPRKSLEFIAPIKQNNAAGTIRSYTYQHSACSNKAV